MQVLNLGLLMTMMMKNAFSLAAMPGRLALGALAAASLFLGSAGSALATPTLLVDRGLPTANLNSPAGSPRSNTAVNAGAPREFAGDDFQLGKALFARDPNERRRHQKALYYRLPLRPLVMFLGLYIGKRGFLDGRAGLVYATLRAIYEYMIVLKVTEMQSGLQQGGHR